MATEATKAAKTSVDWIRAFCTGRTAVLVVCPTCKGAGEHKITCREVSK